MKEYVKIKVSDVLNLLSNLDRDISELSNTNQSISENRDYSFTLKKSISEEIAKLKTMKDSILESDVDIPKHIYVRSQSKPMSVESNVENVTNGNPVEIKPIDSTEIPQIKKEKKVHRY